MSKDDRPEFDLPEELASRLERLSPVKRRLLEKQFKAGNNASLSRVKPVADASGSPAPLSYNQQRLWYLDKLRPGSAQYNVYRAWKIDGPLELSVLDAALQTILERHQVLKMRVRESAGELVQDTNSAAGVSTELVDLTSIPAQERDKAAMDRVVREAGISFDLSTGPFLRALLVRLADNRYMLLIVLHHIVSDGWSCRVFRRELTQCYQALRCGQTTPLPDLPFQYGDFARYQRELYSGERRASLFGYWEKQLSGGLDPLELPTDFPRPAIQSDRGRKLQFDFDHELSESAHTFCQEQDVTLYMLLVAVLNVLLHRYTGASDILVGSPIANRTLPEFEGLIGVITNTNVLRTDLSGNPGFLQLLQRVKRAALDAYSYQDMPFEKLVSGLKQDRDLSRTPLFQVAFILQNTPDAGLEFPGADVTPVKISNGTSKFDLSLCIEDKNGRLGGFWEYCTDLFTPATVVRMAEHYRTLLAGVLTEPDQSIAGLPLLSDSDQHLLLHQWNATGAEYPAEQCIHEVFEKQVERIPDATALVMGDRRISYLELNTSANQLAHYLRRLGVEADSLVGLAMHRSIEIVVGILGILKAGGAYVPLNPAYPCERLAFMLKDTDLQVLLTQRSLLDQFAGHNGRAVCIDRDWQEIARESHDSPCSETDATGLAYVMYTSGSTGIPKGVAIPHRAVLRLVCGVNYVRLDSDQVHLLLAPVSFDASTFELWGALLNGARVIIYPDEVPELDRLGAIIRQQQVTTLWLTASLFNMIIDEAPDILTGVQQLLTGGEALSVTHVRRALESLPEVELFNAYGPTESTTFACCYAIPRDLKENIASIPIGRPIENTKVYILDQNRNPVPVGVPGELYIGGDGLARGYLNREGLTADKFITSPFSEDSDIRLYSTGDRARFLADGSIEYLGRTDHQIKIRGFRIEPGEIESVLESHDAIRQSLVVSQQGKSNAMSLLAYVVVRRERKADERELRSYLKERIPGYMLPAMIMFVDKLPLTPNGKVDRDALPPPVEPDSQSGEAFVAPRSSTEQCIAGIWSTLLKIEKTGVHDNFFELGGDSLTAVQLSNRLEANFSLKVSLDVIFSSPSVAELAAYLEAANWTGNMEASSTQDVRAGEREMGEI